MLSLTVRLTSPHDPRKEKNSNTELIISIYDTFKHRYINTCLVSLKKVKFYAFLFAAAGAL